MINREHVNGEGALQGSVLVEVVHDHVRVRVPFELDLNPGVFIGQIPDIANFSDHLFLN